MRQAKAAAFRPPLGRQESWTYLIVVSKAAFTMKASPHHLEVPTVLPPPGRPRRSPVMAKFLSR
jgi:hypothetical protein